MHLKLILRTIRINNTCKAKKKKLSKSESQTKCLRKNTGYIIAKCPLFREPNKHILNKKIDLMKETKQLPHRNKTCFIKYIFCLKHIYWLERRFSSLGVSQSEAEHGFSFTNVTIMKIF